MWLERKAVSNHGYNLKNWTPYNLDFIPILPLLEVELWLRKLFKLSMPQAF